MVLFYFLNECFVNRFLVTGARKYDLSRSSIKLLNNIKLLIVDRILTSHMRGIVFRILENDKSNIVRFLVS